MQFVEDAEDSKEERKPEEERSQQEAAYRYSLLQGKDDR
jgi:hypothetical protein